MKRVLVTGPSCAGKSTFVSDLGATRIVHLDPTSDLGDAFLDGGGNGRVDFVAFEGLLPGDMAWADAFLDSIDLVLVVQAPALRRLWRAFRRDRASGVPRWFRNEWHWRRFVAPAIERTSARVVVAAAGQR